MLWIGHLCFIVHAMFIALYLIQPFGCNTNKRMLLLLLLLFADFLVYLQ